MNRKPIFDRVRAMLGRGFRAAEVRDLDAAIDAAMRETGEQLAAESAGRPEWIALAAPLVERFEGMARLIPGGKVEAYPDPGTGGRPWTIGIGSTTDENGQPIKPGDVWTVERARSRFEAHLREFGREVDALIDGVATTPQQKAALTSLAYNIGTTALGRSTALRKHKQGKHAEAADAILMWNRAGGRVLNGLVRRRKAERALYLS